MNETMMMKFVAMFSLISFYPQITFANVPKFYKSRTKIHFREDPIPESFDARSRWPFCKDVMEKIQNQGNCSTGWVFAATEVMADRWCIQSRGTYKTEFSVEDLTTCCKWYNGTGCLENSQAHFNFAWGCWIESGIVSGGAQGCKPYSEATFFNSTINACSKTCDNLNYTTSYKNDKRFGLNYYSIYECEDIQREIMTSGPVEAGMSVYEDFLKYQNGVYHHVFGSYLYDHAVKILGWGVEDGTPYWLAANSWGTEWGIDGFFKIVRGQSECYIERWVYAGEPLISENNNLITPSPLSSTTVITCFSLFTYTSVHLLLTML